MTRRGQLVDRDDFRGVRRGYVGVEETTEEEGRRMGKDEQAVRFHALEAARVEEIGPHALRIVARGAEGFGSRGLVGETVRVVLPDPQTGAMAAPDLSSGKPRWPKPAPRTRKYTVRRADPATGEVEINVVLHGNGPGSRWARALEPGDPVHLIGPKSGQRVPEDLDFLLMVGDLTGLPGIARWAESLPATARGRIVLEVPDAGGEQELDVPEGCEVAWVHHDDADPEALSREAMRTPRPEGRVFAWLAGESRSLRPLRARLREEWGLGKGEVHAKGYWSRKG